MSALQSKSSRPSTNTPPPSVCPVYFFHSTNLLSIVASMERELITNTKCTLTTLCAFRIMLATNLADAVHWRCEQELGEASRIGKDLVPIA
jgi:hypothetical protein